MKEDDGPGGWRWAVWNQLRCWKSNKNGWSRLGLWNSKGLSYQLCWGTLTITLCPQSRKAYLAPDLKDWPIMATSCDLATEFYDTSSFVKKGPAMIHTSAPLQTESRHFRQTVWLWKGGCCIWKLMQSCPESLTVTWNFRENQPRAQHSAGHNLSPIQQQQIYQWHAKHKFAPIQEILTTLFWKLQKMWCRTQTTTASLWWDVICHFFNKTQYCGYSVFLPMHLRETHVAVHLFHNPKTTKLKWTKHCMFRNTSF